MRFRLEHSVDQTRVIGLAVLFEEDDIPKLRTMLDLLDKGGVQPAPKPWEPLYAKHGMDPTEMYRRPPEPADEPHAATGGEGSPTAAILRQLRESKRKAAEDRTEPDSETTRSEGL